MFTLLQRVVLSRCHFHRALPSGKIREQNGADGIKRLLGLSCGRLLLCRIHTFAELYSMSIRIVLPWWCLIAMPCGKIREPDGADGIERLHRLRHWNHCFAPRYVSLLAMCSGQFLP